MTFLSSTQRRGRGVRPTVEVERHGDLPGERPGCYLPASDALIAHKKISSTATYLQFLAYSCVHIPVNAFPMHHNPVTWNEPRWNHSAVGVFAVPHWKVFVFGGNSGNLAEGGNPQVC